MYTANETIALIKSSGFFDEDWYLNSYQDLDYINMNPIEHYIKIGALLGRNPSLKFNSSSYLEANPDVAAEGINPLLHYICYGIKEGRSLRPLDMTISDDDRILGTYHNFNLKHQYKTSNNKLVYKAKTHSPRTDINRDKELILSSGLFDQIWYLNTYDDVAKAGKDPILHYLRWGAIKGRNPNPMFDSNWYLEHNAKCREACINPLVHYINCKAPNYRDPHPLFSSSWYLSEYSEVEEDKINPLLHYLSVGSNKGYFPHPNFRNLRLPKNFRLKSEYQKILKTSPILCHVPPAQYLCSFQRAKKLHNKYITLDDYIRQTVVHPNLISGSLSENAIRIISMMDNRKQRLFKKYSQFEQNELVTVIMPTRNRAKIISSSIISVLTQSYTNWELIIIDDASEDNTIEVVKQFDDTRIKLQKLKNRRGNAAARNFGVRNARGTIISYLDDDDLWDPDFLLISVHTLRETGRRMLYSAQMVWQGFDDTLQLGKKFKAVRFAPFNRSLLENTNYISMISCVHDISLFNECGKFNETLSRFVDWDLFLRFTEHTIPTALPCILSHYYQERDYNCVTHDNALDENLNCIRKTLINRANWSKKFALSDGYKLQAFGISKFSQTNRAQKLSKLPKSITTIIVPNFESIREIEMCLSSINENTNCPYEVLIVDNRSSIKTRTELKKIVNRYKQMRLILSDEYSGFSYAVNAGLREIINLGEDVVILNNDTIVTPGWLEELKYILYKYSNVGMSVPRQILPPFHRISKAHAPYTFESFEVDINLSAHHKNVLNPYFNEKEGLVEVIYAPLFCSLIRGTTLQAIGMLDTGNGPHFRSDWIFCDAIRTWQKQCIVYTPYSKIYHLQGVATKIEREANQ